MEHFEHKLETDTSDEQQTDREIPPITLVFGYYRGMEARHVMQARANLRGTVQRLSPGLSQHEAGRLVGRVYRGLAARRGNSVTSPPSFEHHPEKGLTFRGGTSQQMFEEVRQVVDESYAQHIVEVYENLFEERDFTNEQ